MAVVALRDLDLRHLAALRAVTEEGTFGRAATRLGFTQSAVSQQIATLERIVGEPLFERPGGPRPVTLTPAGELLLPHAVAILDQVRSAEAELDGYRAGRTGRVRLGTFQSVTVRMLPTLLNELRDSHPDISVFPYEHEDQSRMLDMLGDGELDAAFAVGAIDDPRFGVRPIGSDPFVVLCPPDSCILPPSGPVPVARLNEVQLIGQTPMACQLIIEDGLRDRGVAADYVFRTGDNAAVQALVRVGMGHAVMPRLAVDLNDPAVVVRELDPPIEPRQLVIAYPNCRAVSPALGIVMDLAADIARRVL